MISFDLDVGANVRAIRRQVELDNVVGYIAAHDPDFEFANFRVEELAQVAADILDDARVDGQILRNASWEGVTSGKSFEERVVHLSGGRLRGLKGELWGRALARYAGEHPEQADGSPRPFNRELSAALQGRAVNHDYQRASISFDPITFKARERNANMTDDAVVETSHND